MKVELITTIEELSTRQGEWMELARSTAESNPFCEPWFLIPALRYLTTGEGHLQNGHLQCMLIWNERGEAEPRLDGFFALATESSYRPLGWQHQSLWTHIHCYLSTPLIRAGREREVLGVALDWIDGRREDLGLFFPKLSMNGVVFRELLEIATAQKRAVDLFDTFHRATLDSPLDPDAYIEGMLHKRHRKDLEKKRLALEREGAHFVCDTDPAKAHELATQFLSLEASGWKGASGTAMSKHEGERRFFEEIVNGGMKIGRIEFCSLRTAEQVLAMRCHFVCENEGFGFKTAFDESYGRLSPGVVLEIYNIKRWLTSNGRKPIDSCSVAGSEVFERLWGERKGVTALFVSKKDAVSRLSVGLIAKLRRLASKLRRSKSAAAAEQPAVVVAE